ncbi:MAG TPA: 2-C-methyl-D-erythritol 4-phosphate cytidylyltransferase [Mycobacteriales bacterium]
MARPGSVAGSGSRGVAGIVPAAGAGVRLGGGIPKAWRLVGGRPMVAYAVDMLSAVCARVVVTAPPGFDVPDVGAVVVAGGVTRSDSVRLALAALDESVEHVLVHDAARPFAPDAVAVRVLDALRAGEQAVVPVLPVADTVKVVDGGGYVVRTCDRGALRIVQTPQGFARELLVRAHASGDDATDDAGLVEALGVRVATVAGDPDGAKITTPAELAAAQARTVAR